MWSKIPNDSIPTFLPLGRHLFKKTFFKSIKPKKIIWYYWTYLEFKSLQFSIEKLFFPYLLWKNLEWDRCKVKFRKYRICCKLNATKSIFPPFFAQSSNLLKGMNFFNLRITGTAQKKDLDIYGSHLGLSTWLSQRLFCSFRGKELFNFEWNNIYPTLFREEAFMITLISIHLYLLRLCWPKFLTLFHLIFARFQKALFVVFFSKNWKNWKLQTFGGPPGN